MEIYYTVFAVLIFVALIFDTFPSRLSSLLEFVVFFSLSAYLVLFAGLRTMGLEYDYSGYKQIFEEISRIPELGRYSGYSIEYGYMLFNRMFSGFSFYTFTLILAFFTGLPKQIYIYRRCSRKFLALAYYYAFVFIQNDMGLLRATIASGILYYSFDFLAKDEKRKFVILVFMASLFHQTAFSMLLLLILGRHRYKFRAYMYVITLAIIISMLHIGLPIMAFVAKNLASSGGLLGKIIVHYEEIASSTLGEGGGGTRLLLSNARKAVIFMMFSYLLHLSHRTHTEEKCRLIRVWYNAYFINIVLPIIFVDLSGIISHRGTLFFRPVEIFLFSELSEAIGKRKINAREMLVEKALLMILIIYLCIHNINDVIHSYDGFIPYKWEL